MTSLEQKFANIRADFPALEQVVNKHPLVYLDSAATTLKPKAVVERIHEFYLYQSANVHRGGHFLGDQATGFFEGARKKVCTFLNASSSDEIVFVSGTTQAVNLVAQSYLGPLLKKDDVILISEMEHHANIVPWQMIAEVKQARIEVVRIDADGNLDFNDLKNKLNEKVKLVAVTACSNVLGTIVDVQKVCELSHANGAKVFVDGAQLVSQQKVDVQKIDCDFFAFSSHKLFGPFGFGVLFAKKDILEKMPPYQGGGSMISQVTFAKTTYNEVPFRFEAGTPHIEGAIGTQAAIEYFENINIAEIHQWEDMLMKSAQAQLQDIGDIQIYGSAKNRAPILSFNLKGAHHSDVAQILDQMGVAVRAGHHCTQPLMAKLGIVGSVRASFSIYNNLNDVDQLVKALIKARKLLL